MLYMFYCLCDNMFHICNGISVNLLSSKNRVGCNDDFYVVTVANTFKNKARIL